MGEVGGREVVVVVVVLASTQVRPHPLEQQRRPPWQSMSPEHEITQAPSVLLDIAGQCPIGGVGVVGGGGVVDVSVGMKQIVPHPLEQQIWPLVQSVLLEHAWTQRPKPVGGGHRGSVGDAVVGMVEGDVVLVVAVSENVMKFVLLPMTTIHM